MCCPLVASCWSIRQRRTCNLHFASFDRCSFLISCVRGSLDISCCKCCLENSSPDALFRCRSETFPSRWKAPPGLVDLSWWHLAHKQLGSRWRSSPTSCNSNPPDQEPVTWLTAVGICVRVSTEDESMIRILGSCSSWALAWINIIASHLDQQGFADLANVLENGRWGTKSLLSYKNQVRELGRQEGGVVARVDVELEQDVEVDEDLVEGGQEGGTQTEP